MKTAVKQGYSEETRRSTVELQINELTSASLRQTLDGAE